MGGDEAPGLARLALVHGLEDDVVPPDHSTRFCVAAAKAGVGCTYHQVRREGHFEVLDPKSASWAAVRTALRQAGVLPPRQQDGGGGGGAAGALNPPEEAPTAAPPAVPGSVMAATTRTETAEEIVFVALRADTPKR